jgi:DNA-binding transcriptional regulator YdaS (Cro superfamily)
MNPMQFAIEAVGGQTAAARLCGLSNVAIHKWVKNAALPRTEYTEKPTIRSFWLTHQRAVYGGVAPSSRKP